MTGVSSQGKKESLFLLAALRRPLEQFLALQASSGIVLMVSAAVALLLANSSVRELYTRWIGSEIFVEPALRIVAHDGVTLRWLVNDVAMVLFFFMAGLEIRRETVRGELSEWKRASLPLVLALAGMVFPALIYKGILLAFGASAAAKPGWGVPMATDIAFALGIMALLGTRVPAALRVLLLALAVIDDLGAIIVIAVFYSRHLELRALVVAAGVLGVVLVCRFRGVRDKRVYYALGVLLWALIAIAGIHPTIAGVAMGLLTPFSLTEPTSSELARSFPGDALLHRLHRPVLFGLMPVFALANAGVRIGAPASSDAIPVLVAIGAALPLGKTLGIVVAAGGFAAAGLPFPRGLTLRHMTVLGLAAGIGFTMSIFVAELAFGDPALLTAAKLGVLLGSGASGVAALGIGAAMLRSGETPSAAKDADEAEASTDL
jgi:Na+:H+ antiporter, NhaA family